MRHAARMPAAQPALAVTAEDDQVSVGTLGMFDDLYGCRAFEEFGLDRESTVCSNCSAISSR